MANSSTHTVQRTRAPWYAGAAAAAVVALALIIPALNGGASPSATPPLGLSLGAGDSMASCIAFDVAFLAQMPMAFEGTVTAMENDVVTLSVDRWFKGGDATTVELSAPSGLEALIGGIAFIEGDQYLISAGDGAVNYCGFSGPATPELTAAFEEAFGG